MNERTNRLETVWLLLDHVLETKQGFDHTIIALNQGFPQVEGRERLFQNERTGSVLDEAPEFELGGEA